MDELSRAIESLLKHLGGLPDWFRDQLFAPATLYQLALIAVAGLVAYLLSRPLRARIDRFVEKRIDDRRLTRAGETLSILIMPAILVLLLWTGVLILDAQGTRSEFVRIAANLLNAWIVIRLFSSLFPSRFWSRVFAAVAWTVAALSILEVLGPAIAALDSVGITLGKTHLTPLLVFKTILVGSTLLWIALAAARLLQSRIDAIPNLTPSVRSLIVQVSRIGFVLLAIVVAMNTVGIDLTALAVFSGALGIGIGFGLQKVVSNFISGIILLLDRSIKPGDVIEVGGTYGRVTNLGARHTAVATRDGTEYLIPNELFITEQVVNWAYSDTNVRVKANIGIAYHCDVLKARELVLEACHETKRAVDVPRANCHLIGFGDNSIDLQARFWIADPENGVANVISDVLIKVWEKFRDNDIEFPFPQRDINLKGGSPIEVTLSDKRDD